MTYSINWPITVRSAVLEIISFLQFLVAVVQAGNSSLVWRVICPKRIGIGLGLGLGLGLELGLGLGLASNFGIYTTTYTTMH